MPGGSRTSDTHMDEYREVARWRLTIYGRPVWFLAPDPGTARRYAVMAFGYKARKTLVCDPYGG